MSREAPALSVVFPLRCGETNAYLLDRLAANLTLFGRYEDVECIVVDSASEHADRVRGVCEGRPRCHLVRDPAPQEPFAPGTTRNVGAERATGDYLFFYDVDLVAGPELVPALLRWIRETRDPRDFLIIPCLFLTPEATEQITFAGEPVDLAPHRASLLAGENHVVANLAATHLVVSREQFHHIGGNRPEYRGHGCEDYDILHRLASYRPLIRRPPDYYEDTRHHFPADYSGFRAYFARYALPNLFEELYTAHLWHPRPVTRAYFRRRPTNDALLQRLMREHDARDAPWSDEPTASPPEMPDFIRTLMDRHGHDVASHPGLFRLGDGVAPKRGTPGARLRKLLLHPRAFLSDSRFGPLRALARILGA